ncbi:TetR/AcrR family transcriptional regulator [Streptomyces sp. NPDC002513]
MTGTHRTSGSSSRRTTRQPGGSTADGRAPLPDERDPRGGHDERGGRDPRDGLDERDPRDGRGRRAKRDKRDKHDKGESLIERRKAATRMEIARAAAGLFIANGLRATRAEDIARAAGVAPRTFYRYFATKEEALAPLLSEGARQWTQAVREAPAGLTVAEALRHAAIHTLTPGAGVSTTSLEWVRTLLCLIDTNSALTKVWAEICRAAERGLAEALAKRTQGGDETSAAVTPALRFAAAIAGAAVRVALETWAAGDRPAGGPDGPAALAVRNLEALGEFAWGSG